MRLVERLAEKLGCYRRVLTACRKPDREEFVGYLKECLVGTLIIGLIGFLFYLIFAVVSL